MPTLTPQSQAVINTFAQQSGVTPDHVRNLQQALQDSPALTDQFNDAVEQDHLRKIVPLSHPHAGGEYDGQNKAMRLPLGPLTTKPGAGTFNIGEVTFVLGHELQHGFEHAAKMRALGAFYDEVKQVARSPSATHDYTAATSKRIAAHRNDEASAEIAGWNAVVSAVKHTQSAPMLEDIYLKEPGRMGDFIEQKGSYPGYTYTLKPNLSLNPDLTLSPTPANLEAMGQNYFDKAPADSKLGHHGNSDYANYYGASAMDAAVQMERHYHPPGLGTEPPRIAVNMNALRLSEKLMEENGINLGTHTQPMPYHDLSTTPATLHHFDHTATTHTHVPIVAGAQGMSEVPDQSQVTSPAEPYNAHFRFIPRTATDDFLDAYCAAVQRGDSDQCTALYQQHRQQPEMQAMEQLGREMYQAEQQRLEEQQRQQEQERQQWAQEQQQHQSRGRSR